MEKNYSESDINISSTFKVNSGFTKKLSLRLGKIKSINTDKNTVDMDWLYPQRGELTKIELTRPYVGFQSGIHFAPEVGSIVIVGFVEEMPILLSYMLPTNFSNMLNGITNNQGTKSRIRKLLEGEMSLNSKQNAEIYIHDNIELKDSMNDTFIINPSDGSINLDSLQLYIDNECGNITMGMIERKGEIVTDDGELVTSVTGGNALTELNITVNKLADNTINSSSIENKKLASIVVGTLVDDNGNIVKSSDDTNINLQISMDSGVIVQIDEKGKIFLNTNKLNINNAVEKQSTSVSGPTQQRSAREGDRITIPMTTPSNPNTVHPNLNDKAAFNLSQLSQLAACFMSPVGPCTFVPSVPDIKLVGEITQGSNDVFVGSNDKTAETSETKNNTLS